MKIVRLQLKRLAILILVFIVFFILYLKYKKEEVSDCLMSKETEEKLENLVEEINKTLKDIKLTYFLCYNSLWGALKLKKFLPWQNELEICILNKEVSAIDEGILNRIFKSHSLDITYNSVGGVYKVNAFGENFPQATLTVFEEDPLTQQMRRVGWSHRVLPPNSCEELHCFPPELIATPMPIVPFGKHSVPIPHDGIEIQKYLFPYSWWKDITPLNCLKGA